MTRELFLKIEFTLYHYIEEKMKVKKKMKHDFGKKKELEYKPWNNQWKALFLFAPMASWESWLAGYLPASALWRRASGGIPPLTSLRPRVGPLRKSPRAWGELGSSWDLSRVDVRSSGIIWVDLDVSWIQVMPPYHARAARARRIIIIIIIMIININNNNYYFYC